MKLMSRRGLIATSILIVSLTGCGMLGQYEWMEPSKSDNWSLYSQKEPRELIFEEGEPAVFTCDNAKIVVHPGRIGYSMVMLGPILPIIPLYADKEYFENIGVKVELIGYNKSSDYICPYISESKELKNEVCLKPDNETENKKSFFLTFNLTQARDSFYIIVKTNIDDCSIDPIQLIREKDTYFLYPLGPWVG